MCRGCSPRKGKKTKTKTNKQKNQLGLKTNSRVCFFVFFFKFVCNLIHAYISKYCGFPPQEEEAVCHRPGGILLGCLQSEAALSLLPVCWLIRELTFSPFIFIESEDYFSSKLEHNSVMYSWILSLYSCVQRLIYVMLFEEGEKCI